MDTIFALSSGQPPAGIAVLRVSGPGASTAIESLAGRLPEPRHATLLRLKDVRSNLLDEALVLWFPGPRSATGEDLAEFHLHGGRAVVAAVKRSLAELEGLREAEGGEFTRRAFANGRIDLAEAEGLADLLAAETELQRATAVAMAGGALSRQSAEWRDRVLGLAAQVEAVLDFSDEGDVGELPRALGRAAKDFATELVEALGKPRAETLREGFRLVLAGPPNAGKSTLFNALVESEAAITSPIAGTTRDVLWRAVAMGGVPFSIIDTAGLNEGSSDPVEQIGVARAVEELGKADLVLWLGTEGQGPGGCWEIEAQCDREDRQAKSAPRHRVSALRGDGLDGLRRDLVAHASAAMPKPGDIALNQRQALYLRQAADALWYASQQQDPLLAAEHLRQARSAFDRLTGRAGTEDMLDALFGRFCIGK